MFLEVMNIDEKGRGFNPKKHVFRCGYKHTPLSR